jgi:hypothetical protein
MSIQDSVTPSSTPTTNLGGPPGDAERARRSLFSRVSGEPTRRKGVSAPRPSVTPLLLCLAIGVLARAWLAYHTQGFIDGDEALVGIQAQHILQGQFPFYFYHQPYMGSLEAYIMAAIFAIAGSSVWTMRAEPILLSLVVTWLTWVLAGELADTARLPLHVKQWFMNIAALGAALPPLYDTVLEMRMLGGYIETFILMLLLLIATLKLTNRRGAGASRRELALRWASIGLLVGFGFWVNPLISYAALACVMWLLLDAVKIMRQVHQHRLNRLTRVFLVPSLASIPACIVGMTPALIWGAMNAWQNFTYIFQINASLRPEILAQYPTRLSMVFGLARLYTTCAGPRIVGGALPATSASQELLSIPTLLLGGLCITATITLTALSFARIDSASPLARYQPLFRSARKLVALPLVFSAATFLVFCVTSTAAIGLWNCRYDLAGRYATPVMLALPFFYATIIAIILLFEGVIHQDSPAATDQHRQFLPPRPLGEIPAATNSGRTQRMQQIQTITLGLFVSVLLISVLFQALFYGVTNAGQTFQSPYCTFAPTNDDAIITYMEQQRIHYAWAINWLAFPIDFKTHGSIIVSDPLTIIRHNPTLNRIPAYTNAVLAADKPSFLIFVKHSDPYPLFLEMLDTMLVKYKVARFPAQSGRDVLVVTPLNKTVPPISQDDPGDYFNVFVCSVDS